MSLKPSDIDHIIDLIQKIAESATKTDFLPTQEQQQLDLYLTCEKMVETINDVRRARGGTALSEAERHAIEVKYYYDPKVSQELKCKLSRQQTEHIQSMVLPLQKELKYYLAARWGEILRLSDRRRFRQDIEVFLNDRSDFFIQNIPKSKKEIVIDELQCIKAKLEYQTKQPAKTGQENKVVQGEQEGVLEPKPPKFLQNLLWIMKYGRRHWKLVLLAILSLLILGVFKHFVLPKFNLSDKVSNLPRKVTNTSGNYGRTPLYARTEKRVDDFYESIENEKLNPWLSINAGKMRPVTMHNGKIISVEGVMFTDTIVTVFWSDDFIPPFIEDAIIKVFDQTIEECRKNNLDPKPYLYEANGLLTGFIHRIYNRMEEISRTLQVKGCPKNISRRNVIEKFSKMEERLKGHYDAALLMVSKDESTNKNLHQQSNDSTDKKWYETILSKIAGGVIFLAALLAILNYLGWLEPIKAFIRKILRST
jgi:hypothetical protein